ERDDVDVLPYLLDDLVAGLLGDPREDRKAAELLRLGRHHDLETRVHFGLRSASRARTVTSSCSRNSSLSGPRNSAGREGGGRAPAEQAPGPARPALRGRIPSEGGESAGPSPMGPGRRPGRSVPARRRRRPALVLAPSTRAPVPGRVARGQRPPGRGPPRHL